MPDQPLVLVVDDEPDIAKLCQINLELDGFEALVAHSGAAALMHLDHRRADAVVLDLRLQAPFDGWHVLESLRSTPRWHDIPVAILTAQVTRQVEERAWTRGTDAFLTKPFIPASLAPLVRRLIDEPMHSRLARRSRELTRVRSELEALSPDHGPRD